MHRKMLCISSTLSFAELLALTPALCREVVLRKLAAGKIGALEAHLRALQIRLEAEKARAAGRVPEPSYKASEKKDKKDKKR
jgi:hypothetical protein